jgi:uncharacterized protein YcaQ
MIPAYYIPERLAPKFSEAAKKTGFAKPEDFLTRIIEEKLLELEEKEKIMAISAKVRAALEAKGISEEETLADFEQFRQRLYHERIQVNPRS